MGWQRRRRQPGRYALALGLSSAWGSASASRRWHSASASAGRALILRLCVLLLRFLIPLAGVRPSERPIRRIPGKLRIATRDVVRPSTRPLCFILRFPPRLKRRDGKRRVVSRGVGLHLRIATRDVVRPSTRPLCFILRLPPRLKRRDGKRRVVSRGVGLHLRIATRIATRDVVRPSTRPLCFILRFPPRLKRRDGKRRVVSRGVGLHLRIATRIATRDVVRPSTRPLCFILRFPPRLKRRDGKRRVVSRGVGLHLRIATRIATRDVVRPSTRPLCFILRFPPRLKRRDGKRRVVSRGVGLHLRIATRIATRDVVRPSTRPLCFILRLPPRLKRRDGKRRVVSRGVGLHLRIATRIATRDVVRPSTRPLCFILRLPPRLKRRDGKRRVVSRGVGLHLRIATRIATRDVVRPSTRPLCFILRLPPRLKRRDGKRRVVSRGVGLHLRIATRIATRDVVRPSTRPLCFNSFSSTSSADHRPARALRVIRGRVIAMALGFRVRLYALGLGICVFALALRLRARRLRLHLGAMRRCERPIGRIAGRLRGYRMRWDRAGSTCFTEAWCKLVDRLAQTCNALVQLLDLLLDLIVPQRARAFGELLVEFALSVRQFLGYDDLDDCVEITAAATAFGNSPSTEPQPPAAGRPRWDPDPGRAGRGLHRNGSPERRFGRSEREINIKIVIATAAKARMRLQHDPQEQIAGRTTIAPLAPLSRQADELAVTDASREVDIDLTAVQRQPPPAAGQCVLERQFEERLAVVAAQGPAGAAGSRPEQRLEQVVAKLHAGAIAEPLVGEEVLEALVRRLVLRFTPTGAEAVVTRTLLGVRQNLVRLAELLEALLGVAVGVQVRVVLARQLAVGAPDRVGVRVARNAQYLVVVRVAQRHL